MGSSLVEEEIPCSEGVWEEKVYGLQRCRVLQIILSA